MGRDHYYQFGDGAAATILHPIVLALMVIVMIVLILLPRKYMIVAFLFGTFLVPAGQEILLGGVHIFVFRFIVLAGLLRMLRSGQTPFLAGKWNSIDSAFSLLVLSHAIAFILLYREGGALINQGGFIWDYLGAYIFLRFAIRSNDDIVKAIKCFAVLAVIFAVSMMREQLTGQNIFGLLGGVEAISEIREGKIRSQSIFQHAILAGTFGATMLPVFILLWKDTRFKALAAIGGVSATVMTVTAASSTPMLSYAAGIVGICLWPVRAHMRLLRWGVGFGLASLSVVMNAPIWFLIARSTAVQGSSGYHRAMLVDTFVRNFGDWWLLGTSSNASWGNLMIDTSNQYVNFGVTGGLLCLIFFILTISRSFGRIGTMRRSAEGIDRPLAWRTWLLGAAMFANVVAFFGISYFDQTRVAWFSLLAMISTSTTGIQRNSFRSAPTIENEYFSVQATLKV